MSQKKYINFVRPASPSEEKVYPTRRLFLGGEDAKKLYLEEVKDVGDPEPVIHDHLKNKSTKRKKPTSIVDDTCELTDKDLFLSAQNNDTQILTRILDRSPDKINAVDDYGWSLLMIACQANSIEVVQELLSRDVNTSIRDKAGNSAQSLVIKNKNLALVDLLLAHKKKKTEIETQKEEYKVKLKEEYDCDICNKTYPDKQEHLSSTIHNINASKGKKIPASYVIPASNRGYQLMLKEGWDRQSGLGPEGSGKLYPIKTVLKKDRKGIGHKKTKGHEKEEPLTQNKKLIARYHRDNRRMERNFRREFY
ncbi:G patch domain and ankyrin repeat-containing protein 1 homolog [Pectinophora gossypiella]|uniref:G patch domain and ankyrin repeat-containing protein 1 homolog n=1 Tax=Pectinophora gossypiella TaxID=13191 RepID=UPI00214EFE5D|nr:G patch domain and ankyrin repeat-containing protein 1 homolog [Pectinophora gossypiella]